MEPMDLHNDHVRVHTYSAGLHLPWHRRHHTVSVPTGLEGIKTPSHGGAKRYKRWALQSNVLIEVLQLHLLLQLAH